MAEAGAAALGEAPAYDHQNLVDLFPHLELGAILRAFRHLTPDAVAEYIIVNQATIPKKLRGEKRPPESPLEKSHNESVDIMELSDYEDVDGQDDLLVSVMVADLLHRLKRELQGAAKAPQPAYETLGVRYWLKVTFLGAKVTFIDQISKEFSYKVVACAIACFLAENKFGYRLQKYARELPQHFWVDAALPLKTKRRPGAMLEAEAARRRPKEVGDFDQLLKEMTTKYPKLFVGNKLSADARHLKAETKEGEKKADCIVCYEAYAVSKMISCDPPSRTPSPDPNASCSSAATAAVAKAETVHTFCRACLRRHAKAACEDMPMAPGGVGLKCLEHGCTNPVLFSEIRHLLQKEIRKRLDERVQEENIGLAGFDNLERCPKCNFAMVMDVPAEVDKVFRCQNTHCEYQFCRVCEQPWDEEHFGVSCEELGKNSKSKEQRDLEKKLNEIVVRKCPNCGLGFLKESGCNKMTCRCNTTQCYVCKESNIGYDHFCPHIRDPAAQQTRCTECNKTCLLWEDASKKDEEKIRQVLNGREEPLKDVPTASAARAVDPMMQRYLAEMRGHDAAFEARMEGLRRRFGLGAGPHRQAPPVQPAPAAVPNPNPAVGRFHAAVYPMQRHLAEMRGHDAALAARMEEMRRRFGHVAAPLRQVPPVQRAPAAVPNPNAAVGRFHPNNARPVQPAVQRHPFGPQPPHAPAEAFRHAQAGARLDHMGPHP